MRQQTVDRGRRHCLRLGGGVVLGMAGGSLPGLVSSALAGAVGSRDGLLSKPIPASGERLPVVGIGTARRFDVGDHADDLAELRGVLSELPRLGGCLVDTAPSYGRAEAVIGALVAAIGNRDDLFIATKVGAGRDSRDAGIQEMQGSLQRLRVDHFDLLQVHNLAGVKDMLPVLRDWKASGRTRYIGISTSFKDQYQDFAAVMERESLDFIQVDYAIDNRSAEQRILPLAAERGMAVLCNLPFGRGRVLQAFGARPLPDWAAALGIESWAQFALKYVASHPAVTCAIPGTAKRTYLHDNLGALRGQLPDPATRKRMAALIEAG